MKICGICKTEKTLDQFSKCSRSRDGLQSKCKACASAHYQANRDHVCNRVAKWRENNKDHISAYMVNYQIENKDRIKAYKANNKDRIASATAQYRASRKELIAKQRAAWKAANPEIHAAHSRNRRARLSSAEGRHTASDVLAIFERQRGLCASCNIKLLKSGANKYHVDHIIPLVRGGSNWPSNLQCLCPTCNLSKHAKDPVEWAQQRGRLI